MIFQATFDNGAEKLRNIVDLLKDNVTECVFKLDQNGIHIQTLDQSHVALVDIFIDREHPMYYRCDEPSSIGVNITALHSILKFAGKKGTCVVRQDEKDILSISFTGEKSTDTVATYELKLVDIEHKELPIPKLNYGAVQNISPIDLQRILKQISEFSDEVLVSKQDTKLSFAALGDAANAILTISTETRSKEIVTSKFSLKYIMWAAKVASLTKDDIEFAFDCQHPARVTCNTKTTGVIFFIPIRED